MKTYRERSNFKDGISIDLIAAETLEEAKLKLNMCDFAFRYIYRETPDKRLKYIAEQIANGEKVAVRKFGDEHHYSY